MKQEEYYKTIDDYISQFKDGKERYMNSSIVHNVIRHLANGADKVELIDNLCRVIEEQQKSYEKFVTLNTDCEYVKS